MSKKQKLELTWIGKDEHPKLEPRILIEDAELSYHADKRYGENDQFDNILIQGDNLLALKALEQDYSGKVKCIYIDPPFNTGQAFEHYDDGLEHSIWLNLLKARLEVLQKLMSSDGTIFIHIDENELGYLIVLADEVFGRNNRRFIATFKQASATGHKAINPGCVTTTNFILAYSKSENWNPNKLYVPRKERNKRYDNFIKNREGDPSKWEIVTLKKAFAEHSGVEVKKASKLIANYEAKLDEFVLANAKSVIQLAYPNYDAVSKAAKELINTSKKDPENFYLLKREGYSDIHLINGKRILFYSDRLQNIDGKLTPSEPLTNLWDDILSNNLHNEGQVSFPKGKKPESLLKRMIELTTNAGDIVLDSFAGSGSTAAVAHKLNRRWITIEIGEQAQTHVAQRLRRVIAGTDDSGISKSINWNGGGGYQYYRLAPSLLEKDPFGNWVISKDYDPNMLSAAICKVMGFTYAPSDKNYWNHGYSTESDFIFVTTNAITHDALIALSAEVGPDRSLMVCCKAFNSDPDFFDNLTLKKIPHAVMDKCEWGKDDYSLNVQNLPMFEDEEADDERNLLALMDDDDA